MPSFRMKAAHLERLGLLVGEGVRYDISFVAFEQLESGELRARSTNSIAAADQLIELTAADPSLSKPILIPAEFLRRLPAAFGGASMLDCELTDAGILVRLPDEKVAQFVEARAGRWPDFDMFFAHQDCPSITFAIDAQQLWRLAKAMNLKEDHRPGAIQLEVYLETRADGSLVAQRAAPITVRPKETARRDQCRGAIATLLRD